MTDGAVAIHINKEKTNKVTKFKIQHTVPQSLKQMNITYIHVYKFDVSEPNDVVGYCIDKKKEQIWLHIFAILMTLV